MKKLITLFVILLLTIPAIGAGGRKSSSHPKVSSKKSGTQVSKPRKSSSKQTSSRHLSRSSRSKKIACPSCPRDKRGRLKRNESAKKRFMRQTGYPKGRKGYVINHTVPPSEGGLDDPSKMHWQAKADAKVKGKGELKKP